MRDERRPAGGPPSDGRPQPRPAPSGRLSGNGPYPGGGFPDEPFPNSPVPDGSFTNSPEAEGAFTNAPFSEGPLDATPFDDTPYDSKPFGAAESGGVPFGGARFGDRAFGQEGSAEGEFGHRAGPVRPASAVRPYLLTAGRIAGGEGLVPPIPIETQVVSTRGGLAALDSLDLEHRDIVAACREPQSLAEVAAKLRMHLNVIRVLADDLRADGQLALYAPPAASARDASVLRRVIDGLRAVPDSRGAIRER
ncbi:DUF742 domain-containing protein [Streptomyces sp. NPDC058045]|uniref:DUF742 domain-containing protein n=1 Tax=Streptomyces sp. NPDC058045 TaxID=3346311 RepID=UPI0036F17BE8